MLGRETNHRSVLQSTYSPNPGFLLLLSCQVWSKHRWVCFRSLSPRRPVQGLGQQVPVHMRCGLRGRALWAGRKRTFLLCVPLIVAKPLSAPVLSRSAHERRARCRVGCTGKLLTKHWFVRNAQSQCRSLGNEGMEHKVRMKMQAFFKHSTSTSGLYIFLFYFLNEKNVLKKA